MSRIEPVVPSAADPATSAILGQLRKRWGRTWNIALVMANAPAVLEAMSHMWDCLDRLSLSPADREVIDVEMAVQNGCHYCIPAHRFTARERGLDPATIDLLASGRTLDGSRAAVIQRLTRRLLETKGKLSDVDFYSFQEEGVTPQQMIETIAEIAHCTMTNFMNRLADTEIDAFLSAYRQ